jgi:poly(3-hydroxybutyrate) depolymerase
MTFAWGIVLALLLSAAPGCASDADAGPEDDESADGGEDDREDAGGDAGRPIEAMNRDASAMADAARSDASRPPETPRDASAARDAQSARDAQTPRDAQAGGGSDAGQLSGPSSGCGKAVSDAPGEFTKHTVRAADRDRTYQLFLPEDYQPSKPYPVVFRFHGSSGNGLSGGLDLQYVAPKDVIIVAPDGLNTTWMPGATDIALFDALVPAVTEGYCVDRGRMFAFGFSAGAGFSELLACIRGNTLRGVGAIAGYDWGRGRTCEGQVAAWLVHDSTDQPAPIAGGRAARDRLIQQNGCSMETEPAGATCVRYKDCAEHPVVWCETMGMGHNIRGDYGPPEVWKFFTALP